MLYGNFVLLVENERFYAKISAEKFAVPLSNTLTQIKPAGNGFSSSEEQ
jgi:hypothetical protein